MTTAAAMLPLPSSTVLEPVRKLRRALARVPKSAITLAMRIGVGMVFWKSAMLKLGSWETTVLLFADEYRVPLLPPELAAVTGTTVELVAAFLLFIGLGARFAAFALLGLTATIQLFVYPENWPDHLLWASILTYVLSRGPGRLSVDHLVARRLGLD
jgi:putative oxidoreductase